jgi:hypothetical protein
MSVLLITFAIDITWPHDPVEWVAAFAAILAAVFGWQMMRDARKANKTAEQVRKNKVQPRLHWEIERGDKGNLDVHISNAGGAVPRGYYRLQLGAHVYEISMFQLSANAPLTHFAAYWVENAPYINGCRNILLLCQDTDNEWWDWTRGMPERLIDPPDKAPTTAEFRQWLAPRLEQRAKDFTTPDSD